MNTGNTPGGGGIDSVFVTGGGGFIGRELVRKLVDQGYRVVAFDLGEQLSLHQAFFEPLVETGRLQVAAGTILDRMYLERAMETCDAVVHLAAMLGVQRTEENRLRCLEINVTGTDCVLNACALNRIERVILASSSEVYGEPERNPIREGDATRGRTVYSVSKLTAEELVKGYHQLFPWMNYTIVRFFNTYGEGQVAQFVLSKFVHAVLEGRNPVVYGDGTQLRGYGHVDDITDGVVEILRNPVAHQKTYNLGNSEEVYSLKDLARKVIEVLAPDKGLAVEVLNGFEGSDRVPEREIFTRYCDTTRAKEDFGFQTRITVEEGIRRIAEHGQIVVDWPNRLFM
jgi:UDP-glucose 4-epimerase